MKKTLLIIAFFLTFILGYAANETVTIDGITYTLGTGESTSYTTTGLSINWGGIENWAVITGISNDLDDVCIHKSIIHNGAEYFVRSISVSSIKSTKLEIEDDVQIFWKSVYNSLINTVVIGKNVRILKTSGGQLDGTSSVTTIYCKDEIPCIPSPVNNTDLFAYFGKYLVTNVYVPKGAEKTYKTTLGWSKYFNIIGTEELGDVTNVNSLDVNGDGYVTSADVTMIYNYLLGD